MKQTPNEKTTVVITGMGALTPLGTLESFWQGLIEGKSGIKPITQFDAQDLGVRIAGEVNFEPKDHFPLKQARRMSRASQMAIVTARMALKHAGLSVDDIHKDGDRVGVSIGTSNAGFELLVDMSYAYTYKGRKPLPTVFVNGLPNLPGHHISVDIGATGALTTITTACASGSQAIGAGVDLIRSGKADMVIAGGVDAMIRKEVVAAFDAMTVLARNYNDEPERASRPFDTNREGFVAGEAAGILVLESLAHARARGAHIYAELRGHAASSDAHHIAAPDRKGLGAQKAMRWALEDAGLASEAIDYINAHGTSTRLNDLTETLAIKGLFGKRAYEIPISSTKSMIGHSIGASGALGAIACVKSIDTGVVHPTINYCTPDPECDLDYVPNQSRQVKIVNAISNSFGFGGQNACLVISARR